MPDPSEIRGLRQLDPAWAFLDGVFRLGGGLPLYVVSIPLGYMVGAGETSFGRALFYVPFILFAHASAFICVPVLVASLFLLLTSEISRIPLVFAAFAACAWTGYMERPGWGVSGLVLGMGTVLGYQFLLRPYLRTSNE